MLLRMADTLTIPLTPQAAEQLRKLAEAAGESVEDLAQGLLEDTAAQFEGAMGDDAELARRIALWREHRTGASAGDVHDWLEARLKDPGAPKPPSLRLP